MLREGLIPYIDLWDHKGIALFLINYLATYIPLGAIELAEVGLLVIASYFISRRFIRDPLLAALPFVVLLPSLYNVSSYGNTSECHSLTFSIVALALYMAILRETSLFSIAKYAFIASICFVLTVLIRANNTAIWCAFALYYSGWCLVHRQGKQYLATAAGTILGVCVGVAGFAWYFQITNSFDEFWYASWTYNLTYSAHRNLGLLSTYLYLSKYFYKSFAPVLFALFCVVEKQAVSNIVASTRGLWKSKKRVDAGAGNSFGLKESGIVLLGLAVVVSLFINPPTFLAVLLNLAIIAFAIQHRDKELGFIFCLWVVSAIFMSVSGRHYRYYATSLYLPSLLLISYYINRLLPYIAEYRIKIVATLSIALYLFIAIDFIVPKALTRHSKRQAYLTEAREVLEANCPNAICTVETPVYPDLYTKQLRPAVPYLYYAPVLNDQDLLALYWKKMQENPPHFLYLPGKSRIEEEGLFIAKLEELGMMDAYAPVGKGVFKRVDVR